MGKKNKFQMQRASTKIVNKGNGQLSSADMKIIEAMPPGAIQNASTFYLAGANHQKEIDSLLTDAIIDFQNAINEIRITIARCETVRKLDLSPVQSYTALQGEKRQLEAQIKEISQFWEVFRQRFKDSEQGDFKKAFPHIHQNNIDWINALEKLESGDDLPFRNIPIIDHMSQIKPIIQSGNTAKPGVSVIRHRGLELKAGGVAIKTIALRIQSDLEAKPERSDAENEALQDLKKRQGKNKADYVGQILRGKNSEA